MSWHYDPFKPMSEKTPADWATDYYIYEQVMGEDEDDFGSGGAKPPKPPKEPKQPSDDGDTVGCAKAIIFAVVLIVVLLGVALLADNCMLSLRRQSDEERQSSVVASRLSEYEASRSVTEPTTEATYTTSYRYTTRYKYTTRAGTTRDDPYDAHGYIDADDFAAENWEEFDDYDEAYDYYEDYMAGYD